ncbi:hypothetical protein [Ethanoligenens sp.]|uniref:hypothetical protein n=1 Tax=Ethanoligenens sp. TaxID=2099655 RepID=UPI0039E9AA4D
MIDMKQAVKFCTAALDALMHGEDVFVCPLCGKAAHVQRVKGRLLARCDGCGKRIEE